MLFVVACGGQVRITHHTPPNQVGRLPNPARPELDSRAAPSVRLYDLLGPPSSLILFTSDSREPGPGFIYASRTYRASTDSQSTWTVSYGGLTLESTTQIQLPELATSYHEARRHSVQNATHRRECSTFPRTSPWCSTAACGSCSSGSHHHSEAEEVQEPAKEARGGVLRTAYPILLRAITARG